MQGFKFSKELIKSLVEQSGDSVSKVNNPLDGLKDEKGLVQSE